MLSQSSSASCSSSLKISLNFCSGPLLHPPKVLAAASRSYSDVENMLVTYTQNVGIDLFSSGECSQLPAVSLGSELRAPDFLRSFFDDPILPAVQSRAICNVGLSQKGPHMHPMTR